MLTFDDATHTYRWNGTVVPSVTTVLRGTGLVNFEHVPTDVLRRAANFGTAVHKACEYNDHGTLDLSTVDDAIMPYLDAWQQYLRDFRVEITNIELMLCSEKYQYAGTIDRVAIIGGKVTVIDIKTPVSTSPSWAIQTAAYRQLLEENNAKPIRERVSIQLTADATYKVVNHADATDFPVFLSALQVYRWKQRNNLLKEVSNG